MTTITIKEKIATTKNAFNTLEEMLTYFAAQHNMVILHPLSDKELTPNRLKDYEEVEKMKKEDFIYIK